MTHRLLPLLSSILILLSWGGCQPQKQNSPSDGGAASSSFYAEQQDLDLRVAQTTWERGDQIGLFVRTSSTETPWSTTALQHSNLHYTTQQGGALTNFLPVSDADKVAWSGEQQYDVLAYYPYDASASSGQLKVSVADQKSLKPLLYADNLSAIKEKDYKKLLFKNALSAIRFEIKSTDGTSLAGTTVRLEGFVSAGSFDLLKRTWSIGTDSEPIVMDLSVHGASAVAEAMIVPQSVTAGSKMKALFTLPSGRTYTWEVRIGNTYEMGHRYSYKISAEAGGTAIATEINGYMERPAARTMPDVQLLDHPLPDTKTDRNYFLYYNTKLKVAHYVAYPMYPEICTKQVNRQDDWNWDPLLGHDLQANLKKSYKGDYSRGHQMASADRLGSRALNQTTFYYTNMMPQKQANNGGIWSHLENYVQNKQKEIANHPNDTLYVVTGLGFDTEGHYSYTQDNNGRNVAIPDYFYKVIAWQDRQQKWHTEAWKIPHSATTQSYKDYTVTLEQLEKITGFDFFPALNDK